MNLCGGRSFYEWWRRALDGGGGGSGGQERRGTKGGPRGDQANTFSDPRARGPRRTLEGLGGQ